MKNRFLKYLEDNFYVNFDKDDEYVLDEEGNIVELVLGGVQQGFILPDPKNISDLSLFLPLSPYLKVLHIRNCDLNEDMSLIKHFIHLKELSLAGTNNIRKISGLENLTELEILDLSNNIIEKIEGLENLKKLKLLDLNHNRIEKIEGLKNLTKLKLLDLSCNGFEYDGPIKNVEGLRSLTKLEALYLHSTEIDELKDIDNLSNLKRLTIETRLKEFPNLASHKLLETLRISGQFNQVESLSELKHLHSIWIESEKEIENMETLLRNKNIINIEFNCEKIRGHVLGIYTPWWER